MHRAMIFIVALVVIAVGCAQERVEEPGVEFAIAVHGGAGTILKENMTPEQEQAYKDAIDEALTVGYGILERGGTAIDAVVAAAKIFEDSPLFNAGKGAVFTAAGTNEMDASIMNGADLNAGAVASVKTIKNPVEAAREVMDNTPHVMLVGRGAEMFAAERGLEMVDPEYFFTQRRWDALLRAKEADKQSSRHVDVDSKFGTAAAVALDKNGNLAAATSTGGLTNKMHGRVGDSPIIGAGTYANNKTCAVSGTGKGEYFMRRMIAYEVSARMEYGGAMLEDAAVSVIDELTAMFGAGTGGIIALDKYGNVAMPFNTPGMYRGYQKSNGEKYVEIYGGEDAAKPLKEF